jgi:hypothetical protein
VVGAAAVVVLVPSSAATLSVESLLPRTAAAGAGAELTDRTGRCAEAAPALSIRIEHPAVRAQGVFQIVLRAADDSCTLIDAQRLRVRLFRLRSDPLEGREDHRRQRRLRRQLQQLRFLDGHTRLRPFQTELRHHSQAEVRVGRSVRRRHRQTLVLLALGSLEHRVENAELLRLRHEYDRREDVRRNKIIPRDSAEVRRQDLGQQADRIRLTAPGAPAPTPRNAAAAGELREVEVVDAAFHLA